MEKETYRSTELFKYSNENKNSLSGDEMSTEKPAERMIPDETEMLTEKIGRMNLNRTRLDLGGGEGLEVPVSDCQLL